MMMMTSNVDVCRVEERVGRQLAVIGDQVDMQYACVFNKMIDRLLVDENTPPYDNFALIARESVLLLLLLSVSLSLCSNIHLGFIPRSLSVRQSANYNN